MRVAIVGAGYVGLVSGACLADLGHDVVCIDTDQIKIDKLNQGIIPIFEPGLEDVVRCNIANGRLTFTASFSEGVPGAEVVFIGVGTPSLPEGSVDMQYIDSAARLIGESLTGYAVIADKSTVPVGTTDRVASIMRSVTSQPFDVVSNPEFLREGHAVKDFFEPSRIVIGAETERAAEVMLRLYAPIDRPKVVMDPKSSELTKYAANSFLAMKIGFINEMAHVCEKLGADVDMVAHGIGLDPRIGKDFLRAGLGWGGSCFPKDVRALHRLGQDLEVEMPIIEATLGMNVLARQRVIDRLETTLGGLNGRLIAVFGIAFKPNTDDTRESAAITIMQMLKERGATVHAYDPVARIEEHHGIDVAQGETPYHAAADAHAVVLATEWDEFRDLDLARLRSAMAGDIFMDARNHMDAEKMKEHGFRYFRIGRKA